MPRATLVSIGLAVLAVAMAAAGGVPPQPPPPRPTAPATVAPIQMTPALAADEPFDHSVNRLPAQFVGHDIGAVIAALAPKGEFETTAEYRARVGTFRSPAMKFAFPLADEAFDAQHDADMGRFAIKVIAEPRVRADPPLENTVTAVAIRRVVSRSNDDWATPSGGRTSVRRVEGEVHAVIPVGPPGWLRMALWPEVPRELAPAVKPRLGVLLVCTLPDVDRPTAHGTLGSRPTVDNPVDLSWRFHYLHVRPYSWWAYDRGTGEILGEFIEKPWPPR